MAKKTTTTTIRADFPRLMTSLKDAGTQTQIDLWFDDDQGGSAINITFPGGSLIFDHETTKRLWEMLDLRFKN